MKPRRGRTLPVQGEPQERQPRTPHEHDESSDSQAAGESSGKRMGALAHEALRQGQVDTDKGPVMDAAYEKLRGETRPGRGVSRAAGRASRR